MPLLDDKSYKTAAKPQHNIVVENREKISISGVEDVESFDEENMIIHTQMGVINLRGSGLHLGKFSVDTGDLTIEGELDEIIYSDSGAYNKPRGLFSKMFG